MQGVPGAVGQVALGIDGQQDRAGSGALLDGSGLIGSVAVAAVEHDGDAGHGWASLRVSPGYGSSVATVQVTAMYEDLRKSEIKNCVVGM